MNDILEKAEIVSKFVPGFQCLYKGQTDNSVLQYLMNQGWALDAMDEKTIQMALAAGMDPYDIYDSMPDKKLGDIEKCFGKCRFVSGSLDEMEFINKAASKRLEPGCLEVIGITVIPDNFDNGRLAGFRIKDLSALSAAARKLQYLSIRGCMVRGSTEGLYGESLGRYLRQCYETAKQVTTAIPCGMSYVIAGNCMEAIYKNYQEHEETLEGLRTTARIVANQNQTAFYAKLLIQ